MNKLYIDTTESPFNIFLQEYGMWIAIGFALAVVITLLVILFVSLSKRKHQKPIIKMDNDEVLVALGGKDNVIEHYAIGSRLSLKLKNYDVVNIQKLNELGFPSVIKMSNKITLVYDGDLEELSNRIFSD